MALQFHPKRIYLRLALFLAATYLVVSVGLLLYLSLPTTQEGLGDLQQGQSLLLQDPNRASASFEASSAAFEEGFQRLQNAPFPVKALAVLPPFRWQVRLLKATHALGLAGSEASQLVASFPTLAPEQPGNLESLLTSSSEAYFSWYSSHQNDINQLQQNLDESNRQLDGLPNWILLGNSAQLRQLKEQVSTVTTNLSTLRATSDQVQLALGKNDSSTHTALIGIQYPSSLQPYGNQIANTLLLEGTNGKVSKLTFASPVQLPAETDPSGFIDTSAPALAKAYSQKLNAPIEEVVLVDSSLLDKLLGLSGPIQPTHPGAPLANQISGKPQLLSTPYLADILPSLVDKISHKPGGLASTVSILSQSAEDRSLQAWSQSKDLQNIIAASIGSGRAPDQTNWIKIISSTYSPLTVSLKAQSEALRHTLSQTIDINGPVSQAAVYLPLEATNIHSGTSLDIKAEPGSQKISLKVPASLTYSLPYTASSLSSLHFLKQAGINTTRLKAEDYGFNGAVTHDLILTRP